MVEKTVVESLVNKNFTLLLSPSQRESFVANLTSGQLLKGKVVRMLSDTTFLLNFRGLEVVAESVIPMKAGLQIQVKVVHTHPQVVMSLLKGSVPKQNTLSVLSTPAESLDNKQIT